VIFKQINNDVNVKWTLFYQRTWLHSSAFQCCSGGRDWFWGVGDSGGSKEWWWCGNGVRVKISFELGWFFLVDELILPAKLKKKR